jgi:pimeloyl-ACP methyl ester carboxylesterase
VKAPAPAEAAIRPAAPTHGGAVAPERAAWVASLGLRLRVHEWGDPEAPPVVLCHGMWDHGRGFDLLAPLLAARFRVVAVDARGHGDSDWADAYSWPTDLLDLVNVLRWIGRPAHLVGHSRGGGLATDAACLVPSLVRRLANLDGFGPPPEGFDGQLFGAGDAAKRCRDFLERRRRIAERDGWRAYPSLDDLVERRRTQNPRLSREWLRYFLFHGARESAEGWVWKTDPLAGIGFGPFRPDWIAPFWRRLRAPMLAVIGSEPDTWGPLPEPILAGRLGHVAELERATLQGAGHFMHMEKPRETADLLLGFLGD